MALNVPMVPPGPLDGHDDKADVEVVSLNSSPQGLETEAFKLPEEISTPAPERSTIYPSDVRSDVAAILWSIKLHTVRRYFRQRHWEKESLEAEYADRVEPGPKLESVSEHSWHIADIILTIAPHFEFVDRARCLEMAILHDKLELIIGDLSPIGRDGTGLKSHAFDRVARAKKDHREMSALERYLSRLRPSLQDHQRQIFEELQQGRTAEAGLLKAVDKLQTLAFIIWKKDGELTDAHLQFTIRYASRCLAYFPPIQQHYSTLLRLLLERVAKKSKSLCANSTASLSNIPSFLSSNRCAQACFPTSACMAAPAPGNRR